MSEQYHYVNWLDGMKIKKEHFVQTDYANQYHISQTASYASSPIQFGLLPQSNTGLSSFEVNIAIDNQNTCRVSINALQAITLNGHRIDIQLGAGQKEDGYNSIIFPFTKPEAPVTWWVVLLAQGFADAPFGPIVQEEHPPRLPYLKPTYTIQLLTAGGYEQYAQNPNALFIGKLQAGPNEVINEDNYIPPCFCPAAHPDLSALCGEFDNFLSTLEQKSILIVQKIYSKNQQNELSELVQFVCDRVLIHLSQTITYLRWTLLHRSPAELFAAIAALARVMKNAMDMRLGSGKEELMNYLAEWSELKPGELDALLTEVATMRFNNNDVNINIGTIIKFVSTTSKLFDALSKLEYIGKKKESGYFVNEAPQMPVSNHIPENKPKRRFFG